VLRSCAVSVSEGWPRTAGVWPPTAGVWPPTTCTERSLHRRRFTACLALPADERACGQWNSVMRATPQVSSRGRPPDGMHSALPSNSQSSSRCKRALRSAGSSIRRSCSRQWGPGTRLPGSTVRPASRRLGERGLARGAVHPMSGCRCTRASLPRARFVRGAFGQGRRVSRLCPAKDRESK
jgi:hypothetical protein